MDPLRILPGTPPEAAEHATPQPRDGAARWRQELERAQWALRTREAAGASAGAARGGAASPGPTSPAFPPPAASRAEVSFPASSSARPTSQPSSASAAAAPAQPFAQARSAALAPNPAGSALPPTKSSQDSGAAPVPTSEEARPQPERFTWPRSHVHVMARDGAAQVWVRDGTLDENERRRLAVQLAARLRASGVRLASLVVNGEEIHNLDTLEGVTSWQSKQ